MPHVVRRNHVTWWSRRPEGALVVDHSAIGYGLASGLISKKTFTWHHGNWETGTKEKIWDWRTKMISKFMNLTWSAHKPARLFPLPLLAPSNTGNIKTQTLSFRHFFRFNGGPYHPSRVPVFRSCFPRIWCFASAPLAFEVKAGSDLKFSQYQHAVLIIGFWTLSICF